MKFLPKISYKGFDKYKYRIELHTVNKVPVKIIFQFKDLLTIVINKCLSILEKDCYSFYLQMKDTRMKLKLTPLSSSLSTKFSLNI